MGSEDKTKLGRSVRFGRATEKEAGVHRRHNVFSESVLFTLGLAFIIIYFAGMLASGGERIDYEDEGTVQVFSEIGGTEEGGSDEGDKSLWELLDSCFEDVFGKAGGK